MLVILKATTNMKKKSTLYLDLESEKKLHCWISHYFDQTGNKITKTDIINHLIKTFLDNETLQHRIQKSILR